MKNFQCRFEFKLEDFWFGVYWRICPTGKRDIWICLLPCLPIHLQWSSSKVTIDIEGILKHAVMYENMTEAVVHKVDGTVVRGTVKDIWNGEYFFQIDELKLYGEGHTIEKARDMLIREVVSLHEDLKDIPDYNLSEHLQHCKRIFKDVSLLDNINTRTNNDHLKIVE